MEACQTVPEKAGGWLAVAVGSSHAMATRDAVLDLELTARIAAAVPVPLVLHGSSGVPDDALSAAVRAGMVQNGSAAGPGAMGYGARTNEETWQHPSTI